MFLYSIQKSFELVPNLETAFRYPYEPSHEPVIISSHCFCLALSLVLSLLSLFSYSVFFYSSTVSHLHLPLIVHIYLWACPTCRWCLSSVFVFCCTYNFIFFFLLINRRLCVLISFMYFPPTSISARVFFAFSSPSIPPSLLRLHCWFVLCACLCVSLRVSPP